MYCTLLCAVSVYVLHCIVSSNCMCTALYYEQYVHMYCTDLLAVSVKVLHSIVSSKYIYTALCLEH